jgi:hypothetical protein
VGATLALVVASAHLALLAPETGPMFVSEAERTTAIHQAHVWTRTHVASMNVKVGPTGKGAFAPDATVVCNYVPEKPTGNSPKFICLIPPNDKVSVKYGPTNGEVFAEVAASRLFWALGFGAEQSYPVRVQCRGCPPTITGTELSTIKRKAPGRDMETHSVYGWAWPELEEGDLPPAERAAREALELLAVFVQHTDNKTEQQRLVCLDADAGDRGCEKPFMLIHDLGQTFGHANMFNRDRVGSVNLKEWSQSPIWKFPDRCVGSLPPSQTGTLSDPEVHEAGRRFLADLMVQLSDRQIRDLFEVARFPERAEPDAVVTGTIDEWAGAFKAKRDEIVNHTCPN